jgi:Ni/Co efflux regulator RcnB
MKSLLTTLMFAVVLSPLAVAAQKPAKQMKATGTVVSATDTSMVVTSGKTKKETTYTLNADTKKTGTLSPGAKVTVEYKMSGKDRIATMVAASEPAAPTTASRSSGTKPASKKSKTGS